MCNVCAAALDDMHMEAPMCEHHNITIKPCIKKLHAPNADPAQCLRAYFDGSCKPSVCLGGGGYLLYRLNGSLLSVAAHYFQDTAPTSNVAKTKAAKDYLQAADQIALKEADDLVIYGDSKLVI